MTLDDIKEKIDLIRAWKHVDDCAHAYEDELYEDFVRHVAKYKRDPELKKMASEILKTKRFKFHRWVN
jgi:hemerythrin-like domain-containing protein